MWRSIETMPASFRDGRRVLLKRKQRSRPPFLHIEFVFGRWQECAWTIDHKANMRLEDRQIAAFIDVTFLGDLL